MLLSSPPGLHRDDHLHEGESALQWITRADERMARKATQYRLHYYRTAANDSIADRASFQPGYTPATVAEELAALNPDFDRRTDQYDRIMSWFSSDTCCPGYSYLGRGHCPEHGGM